MKTTTTNNLIIRTTRPNGCEIGRRSLQLHSWTCIYPQRLRILIYRPCGLKSNRSYVTS
jgi:hypothetical protein